MIINLKYKSIANVSHINNPTIFEKFFMRR